MEGWCENCTAPIVTAALAAVFIAILVKICRRHAANYLLPSGPGGLPLIGNIHSLVRTPIHLKLAEWASQFGDIYTIHLGPKPALVVNDVAKIKEIFSIFPASTGKLLTETFVIVFGGNYGIFCTEADEWAEQRQFCVKNLKTFGLGKGSTMEPMLMEEVNDFVTWLEKEGADNRPVQIVKNLQKSTFNSLWTLVTGEQIALGDTRFSDVMNNFLEAVQNSLNTGLAFLPWLKHIAPEMSGFNWLQKSAEDTIQFVSAYFEEHQSSFEEGFPRDLIDAYIEQLRKEKDTSSTFYGDKGRKHVVGSITSLFFGGGETTASNLTWLIFYLCAHPQVQRKLQEEIERVIGHDRDPSLKDKLNMPYMEAVIQETLRKSSFAPFGLVHRFTEDTRFQNYFIPEGTFLIANLYHVHYNREIWGDPETFRPERFIGGDKNLRDNMIAFQVGKRQCLGEGLARDAMFLFAVKLFQKFHFSPDPNNSEQDYLEHESGLLLMPKRLPIVATPRALQK